MAKPKVQMLELAQNLPMPETLTKNGVIPFLDKSGLCAFTSTCKHQQEKYRDCKDKYEKMAADNKIPAEMLNCVLNATLLNQNLFLQLLSTPRKDLHGLPFYV